MQITEMKITIIKRGTVIGFPKLTDEDEYEITLFMRREDGKTMFLFPPSQSTYAMARATAIRAMLDEEVIRFGSHV